MLVPIVWANFENSPSRLNWYGAELLPAAIFSFLLAQILIKSMTTLADKNCVGEEETTRCPVLCLLRNPPLEKGIPQHNGMGTFDRKFYCIFLTISWSSSLGRLRAFSTNGARWIYILLLLPTTLVPTLLPARRRHKPPDLGPGGAGLCPDR